MGNAAIRIGLTIGLITAALISVGKAEQSVSAENNQWTPVELADLKDTIDYSLRTSTKNTFLAARADFDGNGFEDVVEMVSRKSEDGHEYAFRVRMNGEDVKELIIRRGNRIDIVRHGVMIRAPGEYQTACTKGYGKCEKDDPASVHISNPGFGFFLFESSEILYYWADGGFREIALSD